ncbi:heat shock protein 23-like [Anastrepha obliqua]|uniref:heat shock protein 23-like n=1 Tax=Anastrepha obliqua TaxID=95512 RepID=UPI00240A75DE|nr:heat shock protein 23-like [Anastrepha obliqua]
MSSLPILLNLIDELDRETYNPLYYGNDFGLGLHPHHIHRHHHRHEPAATNIVGYTLPLGLVNRSGERPLGRRAIQSEGKLSPIGKDGLQVCMDVAQFKPSELTVKVLDNSIVVEGKHEERADEHGYISRHFVRRYTLPKDYDADKVVSTLSSDGVLTVTAPKPQEEKSNERVVQIQQTGPAHLNVKQNKEEKIGDSNGDAELK